MTIHGYHRVTILGYHGYHRVTIHGYHRMNGKVHIKDPLLLIEKSSLCGGSGFPSKKCVNVTI